MEELISIMQDVLSELQSISDKLDDIKGTGINNSLSDICEKIDGLEFPEFDSCTMESELQDINSKLDDIQGHGSYNSIADIHDKLNDIENAI